MSILDDPHKFGAGCPVVGVCDPDGRNRAYMDVFTASGGRASGNVLVLRNNSPKERG